MSDSDTANEGLPTAPVIREAHIREGLSIAARFVDAHSRNEHLGEMKTLENEAAERRLEHEEYKLELEAEEKGARRSRTMLREGAALITLIGAALYATGAPDAALALLSHAAAAVAGAGFAKAWPRPRRANIENESD